MDSVAARGLFRPHLQAVSKSRYQEAAEAFAIGYRPFAIGAMRFFPSNPIENSQ